MTKIPLSQPQKPHSSPNSPKSTGNLTLDSASEKNQSSKKKNHSGFWAVLTSTFVTIFLAEMGDKTQIATLLMSAESNSPLIVFAGATLALIATSLIGVLLGSWLAKKLSPEKLDMLVAGIFLLVSLLLLWDVVQG